MLCEQLRASLGAVLPEGRMRLREHNLLERRLAAMRLGHAFRVLPLLELPIHGHGARPHFRLDVVLLGLFEVAFHLILLGDVLVSVVQQLLPVLRDEPQHLLILFAFLVHADCMVELAHHDVKLLGLVQLPLPFQFLCELDVKLCALVWGHVGLRDFMGLLVLPHLHVHLDCPLGPARLHESALRLVEMPGGSIVRRQLLVEWQRELWLGPDGRLVEQLLRLVPLPRRHRRFDCLVRAACLDVVVDGRIHLPLRDQPIAPLLFELHNECGLRMFRELYRLAVSVAPAVGVHRGINLPHALVQLAGAVVHATCREAADDFLQQLLRVIGIVLLHHRGRLRGHATAEVKLDCPHVVALHFLQGPRLLLLLCRQKPLEVEILQLHHFGMVFSLGEANRLVVLVELLVHRQRLVQLVVIEEDGFRLVELLVEHGHLRLRHVVMDAVPAHFLRMILNHPIDLVEVSAFRHVSEHRVAPFRHWQVQVLHGGVCQGPPHGLSFRRERQFLEKVNRLCILVPLETRTERDQAFVEFILDHIDALIHDDTCPAVRTLDVIDVPLNLVQRHAIGSVDRIPNAQLAPVLSDDDVTVGHPLNVVAKIQERDPGLLLDVVQTELPALVAEKESISAIGVQFEPIDTRVMGDGGQVLPVAQIANPNGHQIEQISDDFEVPAVR
mmetsp:Transcript_105783/g.297470  ORF Transcript_105783/g.297470 Transcript_105783/m.297470 type:complete len:669 (+) Transcript_105783:2052-4058(+)